MKITALSPLLLALILAPTLPARSQTVFLKQIHTEGARILSARVPVVANESLPGSWGLLRLQVQGRETWPNAAVTLQADHEWNYTQQASLRAGQVSSVAIAFPRSIGRGTELKFRIVADGHPLASGKVAFNYLIRGDGSPGGPSFETSNDPNDRSEARRHCDYASVGPATGWQFGQISQSDMMALGKHAEFLDDMTVLYCPTELAYNLCQSQAGVQAWVRRGGVLIHQVKGPGIWQRVGAGVAATIEATPGIEVLTRILAWRSASALRYLEWHSQWASQSQGDYSLPGAALFPGSDSPGAPLFILLGIYSLLLAPVNYLVLKRLRRKEASWLTIPAMALLFSAGAAFLCVRSKGTSTRVGRISIVTEPSPGVYIGQGYLSVFSPVSRDYDIRTGPGTLPGVENSAAISLHQAPIVSQVGEITHLPVLQWWARTVTFGFHPEIRGAVTGTVSYSRTGSWQAMLRNESLLDLEDCRVWTGTEWLKVGSLPHGSQRTVSTPEHFSHPRIADILRAPSFEKRVRLAVPGGLGSGGAYLIGWSRQPVQQADINAPAEVLDETQLRVPLELTTGSNGILTPSGSIRTNTSYATLDDAQDRSGHPNSKIFCMELPQGALQAGARLQILCDSPYGPSRASDGTADYAPAAVHPSSLSAACAIKLWNEKQHRWELAHTFPPRRSSDSFRHYCTITLDCLQDYIPREIRGSGPPVLLISSTTLGATEDAHSQTVTAESLTLFHNHARDTKNLPVRSRK